MLQNRVDPVGRIIKTSARGLWMGNRGVIHNKHKELTRSFKHKAWIICALEFKGRHREVMMPNRWTELFFLDEATAFAAGHRPCFECRREDAQRFKSCWIAGNPTYNFSMSSSIRYIDEIIHGERIDSERRKVMHQRPTHTLVEGTFLWINGDAYLFSHGSLHRWTPLGYENSIDVPKTSTVTVLTPPSIVNAFRAGFIPQIKRTSSLND